MKALRLALSFIRVPKLFASLLLWPLLVGLFFGLGQLVLSAHYIKFAKSDGHQLKAPELKNSGGEQEALRSILFGRTAPLAEIKVCRWKKTPSGEEMQAGCSIERTDVIVRRDDPQRADVQSVIDFYSGASETIHVCRFCEGSIILEHTESEPVTTVRNLFGLGVLLLAESTRARDILPIYGEAKEILADLKASEGKVYLIPEGLGQKIYLSEASTTMILILNISFIVIIALWLALRAHRKVLDYFIRNDALLPMVAACGKNTFYLSLWIITALRVMFFVLASVVVMVLIFRKHIPNETVGLLVGEPLTFTLWVLGIISSLSAAAIIASIGELQHRHTLISFLYKYVPTIICFIGTIVWAFTLFIDTPVANALQYGIASLPVIGLSPIILAPLIKLPQNVLVANALLSSVLALVVMRLNARWFAAHLEDL